MRRLVLLLLLAACASGTPGGSPLCGNGTVDPGEECDFGAANGPGSGCETDCKFSCTASTCPLTDPCAGATSCAAVGVGGQTGHKCVQAAPLPAGAPCADGKACSSGVCSVLTIPASCGNGALDPGEDCDFGTAANLPGSGCEPNCKFSCSKSPDSCPPGDPCAGSSACTATGGAPGTGAGQKCESTAPLAACAACADGSVCVAGACTGSRCGDGCLDTAKGEQCDDGNTENLDGCSSACHLEVEQRATSLKLQVPPNAIDAVCSKNAVGAALVIAQAQNSVQTNIDSEVASGAATLGLAFLDLADPAGGGNQPLHLGAIYASPYPSTASHTYSGTSDEDWWYVTDPDSIDASRAPLSVLAGTLTSGAISVAGSMHLKLSLGAGATTMSLSNVELDANIGSAGLPLLSDGGTPGHLAAEHLDPSLRAVASLTNGKLCAGASASSLAQAVVSTISAQGHCSESYGANSTLLDLLVSGCTAYGLVQAIKPTQPDQSDPAAPPAGAGAPYRLSATSGTKVNRCTDVHGAQVDLATCLTAAAYSVYFQFATGRVIFK